MKRLLLTLITLFSCAQAFDAHKDFIDGYGSHAWLFQTKVGVIESDGENIILDEVLSLSHIQFAKGSYFGDFEIMETLLLTPHLSEEFAYQKLYEAGLID